MNIEQFLHHLKQSPDTVEFDQTIKLISENFDYQPTTFHNGPTLINRAGSNEGSCKIFAFAQLADLDQGSTLACFGRFYREDVLQHPEADNHANIRSFMRYGWDGIRFEGSALTKR